MANGQNKIVKQLFINAKNGMKITPLIYQVEQMLDRLNQYTSHTNGCDLSPCTCGLTQLRRELGLIDA